MSSAVRQLPVGPSCPRSGSPFSDPDTLRDVLGQYATGVAVVTASVGGTGGAGGTLVGMTVNSFTSVSLLPPLVLFCARTWSATGRDIVSSGAFAVNVLAADQQDVARRFAAPVDDRFAGVAHWPGTTGSPILADAMAFLECRVVDAPRHGDHVVVVGEVADAAVLRQAPALVFLRGGYVPAQTS